MTIEAQVATINDKARATARVTQTIGGVTQ